MPPHTCIHPGKHDVVARPLEVTLKRCDELIIASPPVRLMENSSS